MQHSATSLLTPPQTNESHPEDAGSPEATRILEQLVAGNELLKKDIAEVQNLLAEAREDNRALRDELEEFKSNHNGPDSSMSPTGQSVPFYQSTNGRVTPSFRTHRTSDIRRSPNNRLSIQSIPSRTTPDDLPDRMPFPVRRPSHEGDSRRHSYAPSFATIEIDAGAADIPPGEERMKPHKALMLLTRERGVQTEPLIPEPQHLLSPTAKSSSRTPSISTKVPTSPRLSQRSTTAVSTPVETRSETSSIDRGAPPPATPQTPATIIGSLVERVLQLLQRLKEADIPTIAVRLKRQQMFAGTDTSSNASTAANALAWLSGGGEKERERAAQARDVMRHLSRTGVEKIVREAAALKVEPSTEEPTVSRRDVRALVAAFRDLFAELGHLRADVNEIVLNPGSAARYSDEVMQGADAPRAKAQQATGLFAPISKLFSGAAAAPSPVPVAPTVPEPASLPADPMKRPKTPSAPRLMSKTVASVGASTATAHVGFSKTGTRGVSAAESAQGPIDIPTLPSGSSIASTPSSRSALAFFAGAPAARERDRGQEREWVVLPRSETHDPARTLRAKQKRLSRNLEALNFDDPEGGGAPEEPTLTRTLRGRGLSDSSIHSTFVSHGEDMPASPLPIHDAAPGMLGQLSKRVQAFRYYQPSSPPSSGAQPTSPRWAAPVAVPASRVMAEDAMLSRSVRDSDVAGRHLKNI